MIVIYYQDEWDKVYKKTFERKLKKLKHFNFKWVDVDDEKKRGKHQSDILISTYILPWALDYDPVNHREYFTNIWENLAEKGIVLSVDPLEHKYLARSSTSAHAVNINNEYRAAGFIEVDDLEYYVSNDSPICEATLWSKTEWEARIIEDELNLQQRIQMVRETIDIEGE
jgi:hypothetical protein